MGLDYRHEVMIGIDISQNRKEVQWEEKYLPYILDEQDIEIRIVDGYDSNFMYFGKILASGDQYEGIPRIEVDLETLPSIKEQVKEEYEKVFEEPLHEKRIKLIAVTVFQ